jgi:hypothetical protein
LGHVFTRPDYRRRGICLRLLGEAMAQFACDGGQVLQLFTDNADTLGLYRQFGFEIVGSSPARHGPYWAMRSPADPRALAALFSAEECRLRGLAADDLPRYCLLYNLGDETILKDRAQGIGLGREAEFTFLRAMETLRREQGTFCVLDNGQTIVGIASLVASSFEPQSHVGLLDYYVLPQFAARTGELIAAALGHRESLGLEYVHAMCVDEAKRRMLAGLGFRQRSRLADHYHVGETRMDCVWLEG